MPRKTATRNRRKTYSKRRLGKFKKLERKVANISRAIEKKFHDGSFDLIADWDGDIVQLNSIPAGTTDSARIGDKISLSSLHMNVTLERNNAGDLPAIRVFIIWDKQNTIATPGDILFVGSGSPFSYLSALVVDDRRHFSVLSDKIYQLDSAGPNNITYRIRKGLRKTTQFDGGSTTVVQGALKVIVFSSTDSAASNKAQMHAYFRVRYTDL